MSSVKRPKTHHQLEEEEMDEDGPENTPAWRHASKAEKSRLAAKYRRDKEAEYLESLAKLLPFPPDVSTKLDKASILRLTISYLKLKDHMKNDGHCQFERDPKPSKRSYCNQSRNAKANNGLHLNEAELMMHAVGGFILFVSRKGHILYASENCTNHIGYTQADLMGSRVTSFIHAEDRREMCKQFSVSPPCQQSFKNTLPCNGDDENCMLDQDDPDSLDPMTFICERSAFYLRMRYQVAKGGNSKAKHTGYVLTQWSGRIQLKCNPATCDGRLCHQAITGLVALVRPMQATSILEIRLDGNMFMSRHNLDMKFTFCDPRILTLVGYEPAELLGRTAYDFHNPFDAPKIRSCHSNLINRGQSVSKYYRFLGKTGEWVWMQTRATIIYNTSNEPQYVVCMNYVIGQDEGRRHLMMEQDDLKDSDLPKGVIDVTSLSSPGPAHSSGYCSADEDHSYSSSKGGTPVLDTPGSPHDDRLPDFSTDTLSLFDMIGDMLPPQTSAALAGSTESWMAGLDTDIEMLDMDPDPVTAGAGDGLMSTLLKETDKALLHQTKAGGFGTAPGLSMMVPSTSAVITQSNVMLSSTTYQNGLQADTTVTKPGLTQMVSSNLDNQPVSLPISLATNLAMANPKANISVAAFPPGMLGADPDAGITDNNNDFALKYAENVVDQQINATLANYFGDNDTLMDSSDLGVQDAPMNGLNDLLLEDTSTLSSFLTATSTPSNSQPAVAPTCSAYQPVTPRTPAASKPDNTVFVVPRNPPPVSSHNIVNGHSARTTSQHHHQQRSSSHKVTLSRQNSSSSSSSSHHKSSSSSQQQHFPGLDDHRYTSKQLDSPPHKPAANRHHKSNSYRQPVSQPPSHPGPNSHPLLLERFLLTKEKLNPNKGSEAALATKAISELHLGDRGDGSLDGMLGDGNQQLLKKLLTEELHPKDLAKAQQEVIQDRRHSAGSATPPTTDHDDHMAAITGAFSLDTDDLTQSITLLGEDHSAEMDKLWAPPGGDVAIPSELDEILKEEMRQNDLWLQHCINELL